MKVLDSLLQVRKPARYIGDELNSVKKDWKNAKIKVLITYPDIYEIGMSNFGLALLYELLNSKKDIICERCFSPWKDMESLLKQLDEPLFSLENKMPINEFDLVGFSLQHELNYTNILTILELGRLKIWQSQRGNNHPLIVGGGPCTLNPEPVADFFDFFIIGDAEEVILLVLEEIKKWKKGLISRDKLLEILSKIEGVYVPSLYNLAKTKEGFLVPEVNRKIKKISVKNLNKISHPIKPIIPYIQTVHDRINLEIMRGCPKKCRFCQARVYYGPSRQRKRKNLVKLAKPSYKNTGYEEICLSSLSSGDYSDILKLLDNLKNTFKGKHVSVGLPSLWIGKNMHQILAKFLDSKRPSLTFAPEVSSVRMKEIIGKFVNEEELMNVVSYALSKGWRKVKLYYMLGLPGLGRQDLCEMKDFLFKLLRLPTKGRLRLNLSFSTFIPRPHTPLAWQDFKSKKIIEDQASFIKDNLSKPGINWEVREYEFSLLETILSRGDRSLSKVILHAWNNGARFDSWSGEFNFYLWQNAFNSTGVDYLKYLNPGWGKDSILPWEYIDAGVSKDLLWESYNLIKNKI